MHPELTIIGDGPERTILEKQVNELGMNGQVSFVGMKGGQDLARLIAKHRIMAVPSRWAEPFGIVALEGIACGCVVVGTNLGGLPEAIGPCGITVANGESQAMAGALESLLKNESLLQHYRCSARDHLARHSRSIVSAMYLDVLRSATIPN
jgi:glycosyltransferase involved in cell wall biosynthesis